MGETAYLIVVALTSLHLSCLFRILYGLSDRCGTRLAPPVLPLSHSLHLSDRCGTHLAPHGAGGTFFLSFGVLAMPEEYVIGFVCSARQWRQLKSQSHGNVRLVFLRILYLPSVFSDKSYASNEFFE